MEKNNDKSILKIINKDKIWIRIKTHVYIIIVLFIILLFLLGGILYLNCAIYSKMISYISTLE